MCGLWMERNNSVMNQTGEARDGKGMEQVEMDGVNDDRDRGFSGLRSVAEK